jgi:hypothetical protein
MVDPTMKLNDYRPIHLDLEKPVRNMGLERLLGSYDPISLDEMDGVKLLNRVDTKYVLPAHILPSLFKALRADYRVLTIHGVRLNHYRTLYFDTPDFKLFNLHVNGNAERYKVRSREYVDSRESFLEVKHKTRKDRTIKQRISIEHPMSIVNGEVEDWLDGVYPLKPALLEAMTCNTFTRVTLVNRPRCERVTIDMDIRFFNANRSTSLEGIAVAEVKMDGQNCVSPFKVQMRNWLIHPHCFSKYCIGTSLLYNQVKKNAMKSKLLWIEKISKEAIHE